MSIRCISYSLLHKLSTRNQVLSRKIFYHEYSFIKSKILERSVATLTNSNAKLNRDSVEDHIISTEKHFLVKAREDPDTFGSSIDNEVLDEDDLREEKFLEDRPLPTQQLSTKQYADIIKALIGKKKIKEAIDVVEIRMIKEDRVKPESYIYNLLLGACGRVGYTKKAFSIYNEMKRRALKITGGTYTALFNACANSPWPEDGLSRATHLRNIMIEKMYEPNETNYNAMIKAFGRCGDLKSAFGIVDEIITKRLPLCNDTLNFLLQSCITDKEAGFRHALIVWHKFIRKHIPPNMYSYNLMLRCARDCGLGDIEVTKDVVDKILNFHKKEKSNVQLLAESGTIELVDNKTEDQLAVADTCPNLLSKNPTLGSIISLSEITRAEDRLLLIGGMTGFLKDMEGNKCVPNIKTITQLLDCIPNTLAAEKELLSTMKKLEVKTDVDFCNMLIKRRCVRRDFENARDVLKLLKKMNKRPDLITYGVLALSCEKREEAHQLLEEMVKANYRLNIEILGALLYRACGAINFKYVLDIMELCIKEEVKPSPKFMNCLVQFKKKCKEISNNKEGPKYHSKSFQAGFRLFRMRYKTWVEQVEVDDTAEEHPWQQFRQTTETDVKHYKDPEIHFKPRHISLFKQKTAVVTRVKGKRRNN